MARPTYQKLSQYEAIVRNPEKNLGSMYARSTMQPVWTPEGIEFKTIMFSQALACAVNEVITNAADRAVEDSSLTTIVCKVADDHFVVRNDGMGIENKMHEKHKVYNLHLIFGHLNASSNYGSSDRLSGGGKFGIGAKMMNIMADRFEAESQCNGKKQKVVWTDRMSKVKVGPVKDVSSEKNYVQITVYPKFSLFAQTEEGQLDPSQIMFGENVGMGQWIRRRVMDIAGTTRDSVVVKMNGKTVFGLTKKQKEAVASRKYKVASTFKFAKYVRAFKYPQDTKMVQVKFGDKAKGRWSAIVVSTPSPAHMAFANNVHTMNGGVALSRFMRLYGDAVRAKVKNGDKMSNSQLWKGVTVFISCLVKNIGFDGATKRTLTTPRSKWGSEITVDDKAVAKIKSFLSDHMKALLSKSDAKALKDMTKGNTKKKKLYGIEKLVDADFAGTRKSDQAVLILTEGDSAKALALQGIRSIRAQNRFGVFPLKGKFINVRNASTRQLDKNTEFQALLTILGLKIGQVYQNTKSLRYGKIMLFTDQDHDGAHIKGLIMNMFHHFWPSLVKMKGFINDMNTPIVKAYKGNQEEWFYNLHEFEAWKKTHPSWKTRYYKGLGTSDNDDAKMYFENLDRHRMTYEFKDGDDSKIRHCFDDDSDIRKSMMAAANPDATIDTQLDRLSYTEFVDGALLPYQIYSAARAIPSVVDGLKPGQRKILYCAFKRNLSEEIKVAQFVGYVSEHGNYHHGEASLVSTVINMAQDFVGAACNVNWFFPSGQFGNREENGKNAAAARYIFTYLNKSQKRPSELGYKRFPKSAYPIARVVFDPLDDAVLDYTLDDQGKQVEPVYYVPIVPTLLLNGVKAGIGTGYSSFVPPFHIDQILANMERYVKGQPMLPMTPWYKGYKGSILPDKKNKKRFLMHGLIRKTSDGYDITEIPIKYSIAKYKIFLEKLEQNEIIEDFKENHGDYDVCFKIKVTKKQRADIEKTGSLKFFKLTQNINLTNMMAFDPQGRIKKYETPMEIIEAFMKVRLQFMEKRKAYYQKKWDDDLKRMRSKIKWIEASIAKTAPAGISRQGFTDYFVDNGYFRSLGTPEEPTPPYQYIMDMRTSALTLERIEKLKRNIAKKIQNIEYMKGDAVTILNDDIQAFKGGLESGLFHKSARFDLEKDDENVSQKRKRPTHKPARKKTRK